MAHASAHEVLEPAVPAHSRTTHVGDTFGRSEYIRRNTEGRTVWLSQELADAEVVVVGDAAVLRAEVTDEAVSADDAVETFHMPMTQVWGSLGGRMVLPGST
jgi:hypothetical protein